MMTREEALEGVGAGCPREILNHLALIEVEHVGMDGAVRRGQIVVDERLARDVEAVFRLARDIGFPIEQVVPISRWNWDDERSMQANNTSGFNYRPIAGTDRLSHHARGWALDINPRLNPYISSSIVQSSGATYGPSRPGTLTADHPVVLKFKELGWSWGGDWQTKKDYQHFEKSLAGIL